MKTINLILFDFTNKCIEKKLLIKLSQWTVIALNLVVIAIAIYVFKWLWKVLKQEEEELLRQKLLRNTELPLDQLISSLCTRKAVLITTFVSAITMASMGVIGAFRHNECLIDIYVIFCIIITIILALGYRNYGNNYLYFSIVISITSLGGLIAFCLLRAIKLESNWIRPHFHLLADNRYEI